MRIILITITLLFLTSIPLVSAGITYIPGPAYNDTLDPETPYSYTLPETLNEKCSTIDCKYITNLDDNIGYCQFGRGQEMLLEITITNGSSNTYTINVSTWEFSPSEITITIGSTLIFNVIDNSSLHNIVLPWETPLPPEEKETPGFEFNITILAIIISFIFMKIKIQKTSLVG
jgi:hypothetical protein|tara:strand:+ start:6607 stop:7128 length:522 start_codon:yes stop_codon:yes gene_type:complete